MTLFYKLIFLCRSQQCEFHFYILKGTRNFVQHYTTVKLVVLRTWLLITNLILLLHISIFACETTSLRSLYKHALLALGVDIAQKFITSVL
jgi:hypothetical protein